MQPSQHLHLTLPLEIQNAVEALRVEVPPAEEFINHNEREIDRDGNVIENELEDIEMTGAAKGQTGASQAGASQAGASQTGASQTGASQTEASQTGASQTRGQPVASADIEYSWTTGFTAEDDLIIANRPKTRLGKTFGHTCVVETQGERGPLYKFKSGAEIGRLELDAYLSQDGIKTLAEKDKNGNRKVWSYKNKDEFVDVL
jgi:hypothetical protein